MNNNFGNGFGDFNQYGNFQQPSPNPYQQSYNPSSSRTPLMQYAFVEGINGVNNYQMYPNQSMLLMDKDYDICYKKSVDAFGKCSVKYFALKEIDEATAKQIMSKSDGNMKNDLATKADIDNINKRLDELFKRFDNKIPKKEVKDNG